MSDELLNITGKLDPPIIALYQLVGDVAEDLDIPFLVVGATTRELVLRYAHDVTVAVESEFPDFAIEVADWRSFQMLKDALLDSGFSATRMEQRIISPENILLEILPFVELEHDQTTLAWSVDGEMQSNVLGFQEVFANAERVRIQDMPTVDIHVATPAGMAVLKLLKWLDGDADLRIKDAIDLQLLLSGYQDVPEVRNWLYEDKQLLKDYDYDITLAAAWLLGEDAGVIVSEQTAELLAALFNDSYEVLSAGDLAEEMSEPDLRDYDRNTELINAFAEGFLDSVANQ